MTVYLKPARSFPLWSMILFRGALPRDEGLRARIHRWLDRYAPDLPARLEALAFEPCRASEVMPPERRALIDLWRPGIEETAVLDRADQALRIGVRSSLETLEDDLALVTAACRALARSLGGVIVDPVTSELGTIDEQVEAPLRDAGALVRILSTECDGDLWGTTIGLSRLGLPELVIDRGPVHLVPVLAPVLKKVTAALVEALRASPRVDGLEVDGVALGLTRRRDQLRLHPPGRRRGDVGPILAALAGDEPTPTVTEPADEDLPRVRQRFVEGLEPMARLLVRAEFPSTDGGERMWVCVDRFKRDVVRGRLVSRPLNVSLRRGQRVSVPVERVVDWRIEYPDGRFEGARLDAPLARSVGFVV